MKICQKLNQNWKFSTEKFEFLAENFVVEPKNWTTTKFRCHSDKLQQLHKLLPSLNAHRKIELWRNFPNFAVLFSPARNFPQKKAIYMPKVIKFNVLMFPFAVSLCIWALPVNTRSSANRFFFSAAAQKENLSKFKKISTFQYFFWVARNLNCNSKAHDICESSIRDHIWHSRKNLNKLLLIAQFSRRRRRRKSLFLFLNLEKLSQNFWRLFSDV